MGNLRSFLPSVTGSSGPVPSPRLISFDGPCQPDCPLCRGLGWISVERKVSDPRFGRLDQCPNVDPFRLYNARTGIEPDEKELTWNQVVDTGNVMEAVSAIKKTLERGGGWVFLWGDFGLAKTLLLKIAIVEAIRGSQTASYTRMVDLISHLRAAYDTKDPNIQSEARLDWYSDVSVLAIDEFDKLKETEFASERRFALMDRRYEGACRRQSITLLASNKNPETFEGYLADRIFDGRFIVVKLEGQSVRPMMSW